MDFKALKSEVPIYSTDVFAKLFLLFFFPILIIFYQNKVKMKIRKVNKDFCWESLYYQDKGL